MITKKKIILEYGHDGSIFDASGTMITTWQNLEHFGEHEDKASIDDLVKLKEAGFTSEEIVEMKKKGVI